MTQRLDEPDHAVDPEFRTSVLQTKEVIAGFWKVHWEMRSGVAGDR
jgi:hypothetical protein